MKYAVVAAFVVLALGTTAAIAQIAGGGSSGIPPRAGLRDQSGTGLTAGPSTALGRSASETAAGTYNKDDLGVNQAAAPIEPRDLNIGFSDRDIGDRGRALDSTLLGVGTGDGAQIH